MGQNLKIWIHGALSQVFNNNNNLESSGEEGHSRNEGVSTDQICHALKKQKISSNDPARGDTVDKEEIEDTINSVCKLSVEEKVFRNKMLLKEVLGRQQLTDLKIWRLVNKTFCEVSSNILRQQRKIIVHFQYSSEKNFVSHNPHRSLTKLIQCIKKSKNFPCTSFVFSGCGNLDRPDVEELLYFYGSQIKSLQFPLVGECHFGIATFSLVSKCIEIFRDILFKKCPNLEHLILDNFSHTWTWTRYSLLPLPVGYPSTISNLKTLCLNYTYYPDEDPQRLEVHRRIITEVARMSPNLEEFESLTPDFVDVAMDTNKIHAVKNLILNQSPYKNLNRLARLANTNPQLNSLTLLINTQVFTDESTGQDLRFTSIINKLLTSSQSTLTRLMTTPHLLSSKNFHLIVPTLPKLKELLVLDILEWNEEISTFWGFTPRTPMSSYIVEIDKTFPNVKMVMVLVNPGIKLDPRVLNFQSQVSTTPMNSVQELEIHWHRNVSMLKMLSFVFPNIKTLKLVMDEHSQFPKSIWSFWPDLTVLWMDRCSADRPFDPCPERKMSTRRNKNGIMQAWVQCTHSTYTGSGQDDDLFEDYIDDFFEDEPIFSSLTINDTS